MHAYNWHRLKRPQPGAGHSQRLQDPERALYPAHHTLPVHTATTAIPPEPMHSFRSYLCRLHTHLLLLVLNSALPIVCGAVVHTFLLFLLWFLAVLITHFGNLLLGRLGVVAVILCPLLLYKPCIQLRAAGRKQSERVGDDLLDAMCH